MSLITFTQYRDSDISVYLYRPYDWVTLLAELDTGLINFTYSENNQL